MTRHDESVLWAYAADELGPGEKRGLEDHLDGCPECREQLASVQIAREALEGARATIPQVTWSKVDEVIGALVEKRLASQARRPMLLRLSFAGGLAVAAAAAALFVLTRPEPVAVAEPVAMVNVPPRPVTARVDRAEGLSRDGEHGSLLDGTELHSGDALSTTASGKAFLHLPDLSHLRVGAASHVTLTQAEADDVALALESGHVAVRASHQDRKGFVVRSGGLTVHVVGTVFAVTKSTLGTEVAVSEGRVRVEVPGHDDVFVGLGERLLLDARGKVTRGKVTAALTKELDEVAAVADATMAVETQAVVAASGGQQSAPPLLSAQGTPRTLPRLDSKTARSRQVSLPPDALASAPSTEQPVQQRDEVPVVQRVEPKIDVVIEEPPEVWPSMVPGGKATFSKREPMPAAPPDATEWASLPAAVEPVPVPVPAVVPVQTAVEPKQSKLRDEPEVVAAVPARQGSKPLARDLESLFMEHAEAALGQGTCERFQVGLEDLAQDAQRTPRTELARIFRARCFALELRPRQAINEYRKYLEEYPRGRFLEEARDAVGP